jgi:hypothetical protein
LDPDSNPDPNPESDLELITDPDSNLQIILVPAGSGCTTLLLEVWAHLKNVDGSAKMLRAELEKRRYPRQQRNQCRRRLGRVVEQGEP